MSKTSFIDLQSTHNPHRWYLNVEPSICVGPPGQKFLFGGVGLASAITALEQTTGRPCIWATAQYLSFANPPDIVDLDVRAPIVGKNITQARVLAHVKDREIFTVNAAVGERDSDQSHQWLTMPDVPPADDCPPMPRFDETTEDLHSRLDMRVAQGRYSARRDVQGGRSEDGRVVLWGRAKNGAPVDSALLAIINDFVPSGTSHALGLPAGANSLDNTLRIRRIVETEWVCCDIQIEGVHNGFVHGRIAMFADDGTLMATGSQSGIIRIFDPEAFRQRFKKDA
ncbi:acyl-CoA thioesterase [Henriciella mobilis]|uniref:acyl-CoA thioesterase n=1 Tax=Henriciella mobilis TaxID=2305467 RepID=UPI000E666F18|nr:acyl-CoA thioesterase domain-containing protein [Henriciella mobilis]RIJ14479.1 acyl-CoA thioesterase [Henriciella mobilis]RIJ19694.1 acyl-CoA thioesterase [Henriciella mobilis]